jgi:hypothetical protein
MAWLYDWPVADGYFICRRPAFLLIAAIYEALVTISSFQVWGDE